MNLHRSKYKILDEKDKESYRSLYLHYYLYRRWVLSIIPNVEILDVDIIFAIKRYLHRLQSYIHVKAPLYSDITKLLMRHSVATYYIATTDGIVYKLTYQPLPQPNTLSISSSYRSAHNINQSISFTYSKYYDFMGIPNYETMLIAEFSHENNGSMQLIETITTINPDLQEYVFARMFNFYTSSIFTAFSRG